MLGAREKGESLPEEYAADENVNPTDDPELSKALLPIGGYKGFGISAMGEILCGVLTGMAFGRSIPLMFTSPMDRPRHLGLYGYAGRCLSVSIRF